jgi:hypothetical protein
MGWVAPEVRRKIEMIRLWNRLVQMEDHRLPKLLYNEMFKEHPWIAEINEIFTATNTSDVLQKNMAVVNFKTFSKYLTDTLMQQYENKWVNIINLKPKLELYRQYKNKYNEEAYCNVSLKRGQRSVLAKIRLGVFPINLEIGRYSGIPREERLCICCQMKEIENEFHILFKCPIYNIERGKLLCHAATISTGFHALNEINKFAILVSNINIIRKTATFLTHVITIRQSIMRK